MKVNVIDENEEIRRGEKIAKVLGLKKLEGSGNYPVYNTEWGTKSNLGLYRIVKRMVEDGE